MSNTQKFKITELNTGKTVIMSAEIDKWSVYPHDLEIFEAIGIKWVSGMNLRWHVKFNSVMIGRKIITRLLVEKVSE